MRSIKSKWTKPETAMHKALKAHGVVHMMHQKLPGSPDILVFPKYRSKENLQMFKLYDPKNLGWAPLSVWVDGCFWHNCPKHASIPKTRVMYWTAKLEANRKRDNKNVRAANRAGYKVLRIWEHEISKFGTGWAVDKIKRRADA